MTAPLSYIFGDNPTNTHYCLLCAQEECEDCFGVGYVVIELNPDPDRERRRDCSYCHSTGSLLIPIVEHPLDHEHVKATALHFLDSPENQDPHDNARWGGLLYAAEYRGITKDDLWDMVEAVAEPCTSDFADWFEITRTPKDSDLRESTVREFIAQEYETQKERVKG